MQSKHLSFNERFALGVTKITGTMPTGLHFLCDLAYQPARCFGARTMRLSLCRGSASHSCNWVLLPIITWSANRCWGRSTITRTECTCIRTARNWMPFSPR